MNRRKKSFAAAPAEPNHIIKAAVKKTSNDPFNKEEEEEAKTYIFKPEFSLASNIGILNRSTHWKDYRDVMRSMQFNNSTQMKDTEAIKYGPLEFDDLKKFVNQIKEKDVNKYGPFEYDDLKKFIYLMKDKDVNKYGPIEFDELKKLVNQMKEKDARKCGPFESDDLKTFVETFPPTKLRPAQFWGRVIWRLFTLNDSVTTVYMKFITSIWGPLLLAGLYSLLQIKDIYSTSDSTANVYSFIVHILWTLSILLALAILFVMLWKTTFFAVRSVKKYKQIIRRIRFGILQANADALNLFGKNWEWDYNSEIDDPDIAWIAFQYRESQEGDKYIWSNCLHRGGSKSE